MCGYFRLWSVLVLGLSTAAFAAGPKELCIYVTSSGKVEQVNSRSSVPAEYRSQSRCFTGSQDAPLAKPEDLDLKGTVRSVTMASAVGPISLRWPRRVESVFGRTPERAMADAARTVSRALKSAGFSQELRALNTEWDVVFLDQDLPEKQIPAYLVANCHPGWMTPPANIYIVAQRVAGGCGGGQKLAGASVADAQLTEVLLHEMGHVIEYQLLRGRYDGDRMRAEGFATWFEQYASDYSSIIKHGQVKANYLGLARAALKRGGGGGFSGSAEDYARASLYFQAIVERRGIGGLMQVYGAMLDNNLSFFDAIDKSLNWNQKKLGEEVFRVVK